MVGSVQFAGKYAMIQKPEQIRDCARTLRTIQSETEIEQMAFAHRRLQDADDRIVLYTFTDGDVAEFGQMLRDVEEHVSLGSDSYLGVDVTNLFDHTLYDEQIEQPKGVMGFREKVTELWQKTNKLQALGKALRYFASVTNFYTPGDDFMPIWATMGMQQPTQASATFDIQTGEPLPSEYGPEARELPAEYRVQHVRTFESTSLL